MTVSAPVAEKPNGLSTVVNTIAAPNEAFETLSRVPTWGWACVIALILLLVGTFLQGPASRHAGVAMMQHAVTNSSIFANMSAEKKQEAVANAGKPNASSYVVVAIMLFVAVFFNTLFMLIGNAIGRGQADFKRLWCGSMNIAVPTLGLSAIALGLITTIRGADSFNSTSDLYAAVPGLGMLFHNGSPVLAAFFSAITVFSLWGWFLNATMLRVMAKTSAGVAYTMATIVLLLGAFVAAGFASFARGMGFA
ncbi:MAG TPA: hypothetical protein VFL13_08805 [Candidatus Baltobacteraceae bacterium]|nr:hypothetical protein [Candidatus Baltobacteraceae bacterium]